MLRYKALDAADYESAWDTELKLELARLRKVKGWSPGPGGGAEPQALSFAYGHRQRLQFSIGPLVGLADPPAKPHALARLSRVKQAREVHPTALGSFGEVGEVSVSFGLHSAELRDTQKESHRAGDAAVHQQSIRT